jgi:SnoaL-like domain
MAWLAAFGQVVLEASLRREGADRLAPWRAGILGDDPAALVDAFPGGVRIDDPVAGHVEGRSAIAAYGRSSAGWLRDRAAGAVLLATTHGRTRSVAEIELALTVDGAAIVLPVAVVAELDDERRSAWIRIYHSQWPLLGHHVLRSPLLARDPAAGESDIVGEYQAALAAGDAARITATFEPDGCFREPAGPQFRVCGATTLLGFFERFFSAGGGILLEHCTVTEDGVRTVLEFNAVRWGETILSPQAGVAVYERGSTGRIREARVYDDVEGPVEA